MLGVATRVVMRRSAIGNNTLKNLLDVGTTAWEARRLDRRRYARRHDRKRPGNETGVDVEDGG